MRATLTLQDLTKHPDFKMIFAKYNAQATPPAKLRAVLASRKPSKPLSFSDRTIIILHRTGATSKDDQYIEIGPTKKWLREDLTIYPPNQLANNVCFHRSIWTLTDCSTTLPPKQTTPTMILSDENPGFLIPIIGPKSHRNQ